MRHFCVVNINGCSVDEVSVVTETFHQSVQYRFLFLSLIHGTVWCFLDPFLNPKSPFNPLNAELNPICHLLTLLGVHHFLHVSRIRFKSLTLRLSLCLSNGATAQGGPRPPLAVSSILPGLWRLLSNFYILASLHLPPLHLPNTVWVSLWGVFLLAH